MLKREIRKNQKKNRAVTLIEIVVVIAILLALILILLGILGLTQLRKSRDARRKADLQRIANAFEDYFNDNGCYPEDLNIFQNCGGTDFKPWLNSILCDPLGDPYKIVIDEGTGSCPTWFKIYVQLENEADPFIKGGGCVDGCLVDDTSYNYGISSPNVFIGVLPTVAPTVTPGLTSTPGPTSTPPQCNCVPGCCWQADGQYCNGPLNLGETCYENCYTHNRCILCPNCAVQGSCLPTRSIEECLSILGGE